MVVRAIQSFRLGGCKLPHQSFVGRIEWQENSTPIRGILVVGGSRKLGDPLNSPTPKASLLSTVDPFTQQCNFY